ncbi:MAG: GNAT family N-acetyltransferase [Myxococcota bacterium]
MPGDAAAALEIRLARSADLDRMLEAWLALTRYHARFEQFFELRPGAEGEVRELLRAQLRDPDAAAWLVIDDPQLVGYVAVRVDRAPAIHPERMRAEITDLWVPEVWRRRGVGCKLAARAFEWAREQGAERVEVRVSSRNSPGRGFWNAQGFGDFMDVLQRPL